MIRELTHVRSKHAVFDAERQSIWYEDKIDSAARFSSLSRDCISKKCQLKTVRLYDVQKSISRRMLSETKWFTSVRMMQVKVFQQNRFFLSAY